MKKHHNLILLMVLTIIVSGISHVHAALAISDKIIKQRIEEKAADTFRLRGTQAKFFV